MNNEEVLGLVLVYLMYNNNIKEFEVTKDMLSFLQGDKWRVVVQKLPDETYKFELVQIFTDEEVN